MDNEQRQYIGTSFIEMYESLHRAVKNAGGRSTGLEVAYLNEMKVLELFNALAVNGIRFYSSKNNNDNTA